MEFLPLFIASYLCGSIPTSFIIGKVVFKKNLMEEGSKNLGATNAFRVFGKKTGLFVLFFDILKGFAPVFFTQKYYPDVLYLSLGIASIAIIGHTLSIFIKFKGGKGVATSAGAFLALAPQALGLSLLVFITCVFFTKYISLGSILACLAFPLSCYYLDPKNLPLIALGFIFFIFISYKHKVNIQRLIKGKENKFIWNKKND
ncbi:MAG: acyl-phosphate glycerol 3-phosphate acyltransferase [Candidatus Cloacimonadota bacterium]|nr:MAG: acyl-phosphate glycerol 3-phosphate acyltransferase [Candidatus Cloacimonadota bacterium]